MAWLGRESEAEQRRVQRLTHWIRARSGPALAATCLGVVSIVDSFTLVVGVVAGLAAIACAVRARRELRDQPQLRGHAFATAGLILGVLGLILSALMAFVIYPALAG